MKSYFPHAALSPGHTGQNSVLLYCLQSWVLSETLKIRLNVELLGFLNVLPVSLFNKYTSILWDIHRRAILALCKVKYVTWILHVCWI